MDIKWERPVEHYCEIYEGGGKTSVKTHDNTPKQTVPMSFAVEKYGRQLDGATRRERRIVLRAILRDQKEVASETMSILLRKLGFNIHGVNHGGS